MATKKRGTETLGDMARSLGLVMLIVVALYLISRAPGSDEQVVRPVAYLDDVSVARDAATFPVFAPAATPSGWTPTSAFTHGTGGDQGGPFLLRIGFVTGDQHFAGMAQGAGDVDALTTEVAGDGVRPAGTATLGGQDWQVLTRDGSLTYRRAVEGGALLVTGDRRGDVEALVAALQPG